jgi:23S rRNA pseudouridine1911/1915/1917 synthase
MAELGHPLLGDMRYGPKTNERLQIALWAENISFAHPTTRKELKFRQSPPAMQPWTEFHLEL